MFFQDLGIREEVGYQTLLYPNVYEIRQIMISLIEKLPKQAIQADEHKCKPIFRKVFDNLAVSRLANTNFSNITL